ncbi:hypothetical protein N9T11_00990 [Candidatus Pelagibacter sp.]|jgi:hypothetical protein|nr:hypothetical protein [Candidatus Pelagibacter sp.]MDA9658353.1 hypothetical protein [Candidatus Pelagibacter sp.]
MNALFLGLGSIRQRHLRNLYNIDKNIKFFAIRKKFSTPLLINKKQAIKGNIQKKYKIADVNFLEALKKDKKIEKSYDVINGIKSLKLALQLKKNR